MLDRGHRRRGATAVGIAGSTAVYPHASVSPWAIDPVRRTRGGPVVVPRQHAPLAHVLPYRRAAGELPSSTNCADVISQLGWSVVLGDGRLGDALLALG